MSNDTAAQPRAAHGDAPAPAALLSYADEVSVAPGGRLRFAVSCRGFDRYEARVVRVLAPTAGSRAPAAREQEMPCPFTGSHAARWQPIDAGSWGYAPLVNPFERGASLQAFIWPTLLNGRAQFVIGTWSDDSRRGIGLRIRSDNTLEVVIGDGSTVHTLAADRALLERHWYFVAARYDAASRRLQLTQQPLQQGVQTVEPNVERELRCALGALGPSDGVTLAAVRNAPGRPGRRAPWRVGDHYFGKIDRARIFSRALSDAAMARLAEPDPSAFDAGLSADPDLQAAWDFSQQMDSEVFVDLGPHRRDGRWFNLPTRASTGANWRGQVMDWKQAPQLYGAVHFHADDLHDCDWEFQHELSIPDDGSWRSGVYALKVSAGDLTFHAVFFVTGAPRPARTAADGHPTRVAFLASTATYQVYTNLKARFINDFWEVSQGRLIQMDLTDRYMFDLPELGLSTYDRHADGSGVAFVSRLRPSTTVRPDGRLWNFPADLLYVDWLEHDGIAYDIVTDDGLHHEGVSCLDGYDVLMTGSHPEYFTTAMMRTMEAFLARGGRLMYMGGNGFYWKCAMHPRAKGVIELRRAEDGLRAWDAEPGEYYHACDGEYGGLWRRNGITPQMLTGVGFVAQGFDASSYYRRTEASQGARAGFIFEGVSGEVFGDAGLMGGGAAGMEIDAADRRLGTPAHALVLARSEGHSNIYELVNEEITIAHGANNVLHNPKVRAEMTFFETPAGGAVFCTGSIAYVGALYVNQYDNPCVQIARNVLARFRDPAPFTPPPPSDTSPP